MRIQGSESAANIDIVSQDDRCVMSGDLAGNAW